MKRLRLMILCLPLLGTLGCSICKSEFDHHFPAYGGIIQRSDPTSGRVGSTFGEAGFRREVDPDSERPRATKPENEEPEATEEMGSLEP